MLQPYDWSDRLLEFKSGISIPRDRCTVVLVDIESNVYDHEAKLLKIRLPKLGSNRWWVKNEAGGIVLRIIALRTWEISYVITNPFSRDVLIANPFGMFSRHLFESTFTFMIIIQHLSTSTFFILFMFFLSCYLRCLIWLKFKCEKQSISLIPEMQLDMRLHFKQLGNLLNSLNSGLLVYCSFILRTPTRSVLPSTIHPHHSNFLRIMINQC